MLHGAFDEGSERRTDELTVALYPFCVYRDHHSATQGSPDWHFLVENEGEYCRVRANEDAIALTMIAGPSAHFTPTGEWYWNVFHRRERERGLPDHEDVYQPGYFRIQLTPGMRTTLVLSAEPEPFGEFVGAHHEDSMISLPGLLLSTGRYSEAKGLLRAIASFTQDGLIPNRFPDTGEAPEYNTADATLWMFHALHTYLTASGDWPLLKELFPTLSSIVDWHIRGTKYGIGIDPRDGLLHAGAPGVQLTWMDAKVDDLVVTPRRGKPVEVNALWYNTLSLMESWAVRLSTDATLYGQLRSQVRQNFAARFWYEEGGHLYDVVDVEGTAGKNDASLRPNQLFAASLTRDLLTDAQIQAILQRVTEHLLTPAGLRSLSPDDPKYHPQFKGNRKERDAAYHQGTVWQWLIGPYIDVHLRLNNDLHAVRELLQPIIKQLWSTCLGTISEAAEPEPPYTPAGCFAQAWSVAEVLRCWLLTTE